MNKSGFEKILVEFKKDIHNYLVEYCKKVDHDRSELKKIILKLYEQNKKIVEEKEAFLQKLKENGIKESR